ncbi:putative non-specific serine/threonine protein kinase [Helianthus anomalus]
MKTLHLLSDFVKKMVRRSWFTNMDDNWKARISDFRFQISDFGLSKIALTDSANSVIFTGPSGTPGYVDPQILYGVLFGKLVAVPGYLGDSRFTVKMAKKHYLMETLHMMIDPDVSNEMNSDSLRTFSTIAYQCLEERTEDRPTMSLVVEALEKALFYQQVSFCYTFGTSFSHSWFLNSCIFGRNQVSTCMIYTLVLLESKQNTLLTVYVMLLNKEDFPHTRTNRNAFLSSKNQGIFLSFCPRTLVLMIGTWTKL